MIVSLLMPLLVAGTIPADSANFVSLPVEATAAAAVFGDPPVRIDLNERVYRPGERARVRVRADEDGYLLVFQVDVDGNLRVLFPLDPFDDSYVRGDKRIELDGRGDRETFIVEGREGQGWIYAAWSRMPFQVERYALGDHWDYGRLSPNRLPQSPEPELTELVRGIARASFDYDILPYTVAQRQVASTVVYRNDPFYYDCLGCGYYGPRYRSGITIHIGGSRYYDCWDPFWCDPYYYDPFYYRPRYVYYAPRYHRYYGPPIIYRPRYYARNPTRSPYYDGFGDGVPYRDRRADGGTGVRLVSDNTVYAPPPRRILPGAAGTPARRQMEDPGYDAGGVVPERRPDANRAEPAQGRSSSPEPEARPSDRPGRAADQPARRPVEADRPADQPRSAEPRRAEPRQAEPRQVEPRQEQPRTPSAEPRRRDAGPSQSGAEMPEEIDARPSRPREDRPATPSRAAGEDRARSQDRAEDRPQERSRTADRSREPSPQPRAQPAPERRSAPQARSGGESRSSGSSARSGGSSGGSRSTPSSGGGGRRRAP